MKVHIETTIIKQSVEDYKAGLGPVGPAVEADVILTYAVGGYCRIIVLTHGDRMPAMVFDVDAGEIASAANAILDIAKHSGHFNG